MVGASYALVPEGARGSITEIQDALAIERAASGGFSQLIWIPPGLQIADEQQRKVVEQLRMNPRLPSGTDLLETPLEDLRTLITAWLNNGKKAGDPIAPRVPPSSGYAQLYLLYDPRDAASITPWTEFLFKDFEVIHPVFEGDEAEIRNGHEDNLRNCDGVLIFYGAANEFWLRQKLREVQKSPGYGRTKPMPVVGICLVPPKTPGKDRFVTHDAMFIAQSDGFSPGPLQPFVARMKGEGAAGHGDATASAV